MFERLTRHVICFSDTYLDKWYDCFCRIDGTDNDNDRSRGENCSSCLILSLVERRWN